MPGLVPGVHVLATRQEKKTWMAGTKPGHDEKGDYRPQRNTTGSSWRAISTRPARAAG